MRRSSANARAGGARASTARTRRTARTEKAQCTAQGCPYLWNADGGGGVEQHESPSAREIGVGHVVRVGLLAQGQAQETKHNLPAAEHRTTTWVVSTSVDPRRRSEVAATVAQKRATAQERQSVVEHSGVAAACDALTRQAMVEVHRGGNEDDSNGGATRLHVHSRIFIHRAQPRRRRLRASSGAS